MCARDGVVQAHQPSRGSNPVVRSMARSFAGNTPCTDDYVYVAPASEICIVLAQTWWFSSSFDLALLLSSRQVGNG